MGTLAMLPARVTAVEMQIVQLRSEMQAEFSAIREEFRRDINSGIEALRLEIRTGDEKTRRYMRVLHEEVIARIATIQEGNRPATS